MNYPAASSNIHCEIDDLLAFIVLNHSAAVQDAKERAIHLRAKLESRLSPQQISSIQAQARTKTFDAVVNGALTIADAKWSASA